MVEYSADVGVSIDWVHSSRKFVVGKSLLFHFFKGYECACWDMLEARVTNIPAWFVVFIVLPLVSYFLLGKCSESAKRKQRVSLIAEGAAEEALRVDNMAVGSVMPVSNLPNCGIRQCASCFGPAKTRCSQCKSVWYCSGRCQIVHWRQVHKLECVQLGKDCWRSSLKPTSNEASYGRLSYDETGERYSFKYDGLQPNAENAPSEDIISPPLTTLTSAATLGVMRSSGKSVINRRSVDMSALLKGNRDFSRLADGAALKSSDEVSGGVTQPSFSESSEDAYLRDAGANIPLVSCNGEGDLRGTLHESGTIARECLNASNGGSNCEILNASTTSISGTNAQEIQMDLMKQEYLSQKRIPCSDETKGSKRNNKSRIISNSQVIEQHKSSKTRVKASKESPSSDTNIHVQTANESRVARLKDIPLQVSDKAANLGNMRTMAMKKSENIDHRKDLVDSANRQTKLKTIFPYEEFVEYYQFEVFNLTPRGLVNCGNSCYANAVLQCLTCTKPLIVYLLRQSHSRAGCTKDWCLMCELEQLVLMLRESGGPLSPINILMYIRSLNSQIGDGSQEDAHEFLRLLVASMQSICLESFGGEKFINPRLQATTFIQHMFGGCLRSKVTCLRCLHESECYENMMDLTLEIYGRVESLEDALMQFTSSEDLDGENMYRCPRCAAYVRARKQLNIQEAPNILTIVLKRFQEGNYGKINKCITFPEMLDMVPFMTGTDDVPPLYMLYGVVVHLDKSNASFSGHYISYVKDLQGNWLRVDDTEVQPVELSQVMSEGAYILFYMRSHSRPARVNGKSSRCRIPGLPKYSSSKIQRSSRPEQSKPNHNFAGREPSSDHRLDTNVDQSNISRGILIRSENKSRPSTLKNYAEFSDKTSSDWSLFTSSDDSSFTTESTRDSFSTMDHADVPFSSIFQSFYPADQSTISCSMFQRSIPQTGFAQEERGFVSVSCAPPRSQRA